MAVSACLRFPTAHWKPFRFAPGNAARPCCKCPAIVKRRAASVFFSAWKISRGQDPQDGKNAGALGVPMMVISYTPPFKRAVAAMGSVGETSFVPPLASHDTETGNLWRCLKSWPWSRQ